VNRWERLYPLHSLDEEEIARILRGCGWSERAVEAELAPLREARARAPRGAPLPTEETMSGPLADAVRRRRERREGHGERDQA
jgi:hypothetical protein